MKSWLIIILFAFGQIGLSQSLSLDSTFTPFFDIRNQSNVSIRDFFEVNSGNLILSGNFKIHGISNHDKQTSLKINGNRNLSFQPTTGSNGGRFVKITNAKYAVGQQFYGKIDTNGISLTLPWAINYNKTVQCSQGTPYFYSDGSSIFPNWFSQTANGPCPIINLPDTFPGRYLVKVTPQGLWDSTFAAFPNWTPSGVIRYDSTRLLVYGSPSQFTHYNGVRVNGLCRIFHDGSLDTTFTSPMVDTSAFNVIIPRLPDSSGKIFICGKFLIKDYPNQYNTLIRLTANGRLDSTFSFNNGPTHNIVHGGANVITKTDDGGYLVGGTFNSYQGAIVSSIAKIDSVGIIEPQYFSNGGPDSSGINTLGIPTVNKILKSKFGGYYVAGNFLKWDGQPSQPIVRIHGLNTTVGINETGLRAEPRSEVSVYPNPTTGKIQLQANSKITGVEVFDLTGTQFSLKQKNQELREVNISHLQTGIYFLKVTLVNGEVVMKKLVRH